MSQIEVYLECGFGAIEVEIVIGWGGFVWKKGLDSSRPGLSESVWP